MILKQLFFVQNKWPIEWKLNICQNSKLNTHLFLCIQVRSLNRIISEINCKLNDFVSMDKSLWKICQILLAISLKLKLKHQLGWSLVITKPRIRHPIFRVETSSWDSSWKFRKYWRLTWTKLLIFILTKSSTLYSMILSHDNTLKPFCSQQLVP